jgi:prevent-host-death family protein
MEVNMPSLDRIKPISYFKANAAEMLRELRESGEPYVITQNGEAAAVLIGAKEYDMMRDSMLMVQLVTMSEEDVKAGRTMTIDDAFRKVKEHLGRMPK